MFFLFCDSFGLKPLDNIGHHQSRVGSPVWWSQGSTINWKDRPCWSLKSLLDNTNLILNLSFWHFRRGFRFFKKNQVCMSAFYGWDKHGIPIKQGITCYHVDTIREVGRTWKSPFVHLWHPISDLIPHFSRTNTSLIGATMRIVKNLHTKHLGITWRCDCSFSLRKKNRHFPMRIVRRSSWPQWMNDVLWDVWSILMSNTVLFRRVSKWGDDVVQFWSDGTEHDMFHRYWSWGKKIWTTTNYYCRTRHTVSSSWKIL
jgi:hypothetical protein